MGRIPPLMINQHSHPYAGAEVRRSRLALLDLTRLGSALAYRETGDPFAGEIGHPSLHTGVLIPGLGAWLAGLIDRLTPAKAPRPAGR